MSLREITKDLHTDAERTEFAKKLLSGNIPVEDYATWLPSTVAYHHYLLELLHDPARKHLIKAHLYCRHMGDLYGGQILAKRVPGQGRFYKFKDPERLKEQIRAELTDDLGDEARVAFEWAIKIMRDLNNEPSVEHAD